jgi:hypothetical protein
MMKITAIAPQEMVLFILFVLYIVFPMDMPYLIASWIDSALGMVVLFVIAVYLFLNTNPLLGVLFVYVAYELIRRSSNVTARSAIIQYTPSQEKKDVTLTSLNAPLEKKTLEEEMVEIRAPIGKELPTEYIESGYKPVSDKIIAGVSVV